MARIKRVWLLVLAATLAFLWHAQGAVRGVGAERPGLIPAAQATVTAGSTLVIDSPAGGEALQGLVTVMGTAQGENFVSYEVTFAYQSDPTQTWFWIGQSRSPVTEGALIQWDTTTITDGEYRLRIQMFQSGERPVEVVLEGLRVRNYNRIETSTPPAPAETNPAAPPRPTPTSTSTPLPDFTPASQAPAAQATNPVQLGRDRLIRGVSVGMALVAGVMGLGLLYAGLRALLRR